ncbi:unnamed protein product, partial [marine sediment metagenome]
NPIVTQVASFDGPISAEWIEIAVSPLLVASGAVFDLSTVVNEPPASPTQWNGNWNYTTPNNDTVPIAGAANQSNKTLGVVNFNAEDADAGDKTVGLDAVAVGDTIAGAGRTWTVQSIAVNAGVYSFGVSPALQGTAGLDNFVFSVIVPTPIEYAVDVDYNADPSNIKGLFIVDGAYENITPDDNQYGVDILVQEAVISDQWEIVAVSEGLAGG